MAALVATPSYHAGICSAGGADSGAGIAAGRKRKPGDRPPPRAARANEVAQLREVRLPASTMLYTAQELDSDSREFFLHHSLARAASTNTEACSDSAPARVRQVKARAALHLLHCEGAGSGMEACQLQELLEEASARSLDGVLLASQMVLLLQSSDQTVLIDDDKQDGLSQQLLTDMFLRMSLR
mmetsp:Transcript_8373/g.15401  ORF Transcript_8373/g.15401 Transcript_8373/m.15401 type:complete len:184 (+) Transcript_8373:44-595(+)